MEQGGGEWVFALAQGKRATRNERRDSSTPHGMTGMLTLADSFLLPGVTLGVGGLERLRRGQSAHRLESIGEKRTGPALNPLKGSPARLPHAP